MFQKDLLVLPVVILALLLVILFLIFDSRGELPELMVKSERDEVFAGAGDQLRPLPAPAQTPVAEGERVRVQNAGWATLRFQDGVTAEILRQGQLISQSVDPESELLKFIQDVGTVFNDFNAQKTVIKRLEIDHEFNQNEFNLGEVRIVSTTAYGTKFIVVREDKAPLLWVVGLEAAENDLRMIVTDGGQTSPPFSITSSTARWVAPIGEPSLPVSVPLSQIELWLNNLRNGQLQSDEIGDVIWGPANDKIDGQDFQNIARLTLQRGTVVPVPVQGGVQGAIELTLDPDDQSGNPVIDVPMEDCNTDGLLDLPIRGNETLAINFRPTTARVRNLEVEIYNRAGPFSASLQMFDPAHRPIGPIIGSMVGQGITETLKAAITPAEGVFHSADLKMFDGCLLALTLIPPSTPPPPTPPTETPTSTPTVTPTVTPITPPTTPPQIVTPPPVVTPTAISQCPPPPGWVEYIAQYYDTWGNLSERVYWSVYDLQRANCRTDQLQTGQHIYLPFIPPPPTVSIPTPGSPPTRTPTPIVPLAPIINVCTPSSIEVGQILTEVSPDLGIDFFCTGRNFRPNEAGFRAELVGPVGTTPHRIVLAVRGGTDLNFQATLPPNLPVGKYDLVVTNPDGRVGIAPSVFEVKDPSSSAEIPYIAFNNASYVVDEADNSISIPVVLNKSSASTITVDYTTLDNPAVTGGDYTPTMGTLSFFPGVTIQSITVQIIDDSLDEFDETLNLALSNPVNATLGAPAGAVLTIQDNDPEAIVKFCQDYSYNGAYNNIPIGYSAGESDSRAIIWVCADPSGKEIAVDYTTSDGTATAGSDYTAVSGSLTFTPDQMQQSIQVPILNDTLDEENETVILTLSNVRNATLDPLNSTTLTIFDDDESIPVPVPTPLEPGVTSPVPQDWPALGPCTSLLFGWTEVSYPGGIRGYEIILQQAIAPDQWERIEPREIISETSIKLGPLPINNGYRWNVSAVDSSGKSSQPSAWLYFHCDVVG